MQKGKREGQGRLTSLHSIDEQLMTACKMTQEDARCGDTPEHSHAKAPLTMTCSPEPGSVTGNMPCADDDGDWTQEEEHGKDGDTTVRTEDERMHRALEFEPCASVDDETLGLYDIW